MKTTQSFPVRQGNTPRSTRNKTPKSPASATELCGAVLPSQSCNNSNEPQVPLDGLSPAYKKTADTLRRNLESFINTYHVENVGFLTLTFADNVSDPKEAGRRFNSLSTGFLKKHPLLGEFISIKERQKRGAWHFHLIINTNVDIQTGVTWEQRKGWNSENLSWKLVPETIPDSLRKLWAELREVLPKYGFGRSELLPLRTNAEAVSKYLAKYISKHIGNRLPEDKGVRLINYSGKWLRSSPKFQWLTDNSTKWRTAVRFFSKCHNLGDLDDIKFHCGQRWAFNLYGYIMGHDWKEEDESGRFNFIKYRGMMRRYLNVEAEDWCDDLRLLAKMGLDSFEELLSRMNPPADIVRPEVCTPFMYEPCF